MKTEPRIGSISTGTLRTRDLLKAFSDELERLDPIGNEFCIGEARAVIPILDTPLGWRGVHNYPQDVLHQCFNALEELAPVDCYFGAHDGDGADFGFWPLPLGDDQ